MNYTSEKLTENYTYSIQFEEKENQSGIYYIDNSENFIIYPWNIYENEDIDSIENLADVYVNEVAYIYVPVGTEYYRYLEIPFSGWEYNEENGLLFYNDFIYNFENIEYSFDIWLDYSDYMLFEFVNSYNYYIYESEIISFMKEKIDKQEKSITQKEFSEIIIHLNESLQTLLFEETGQNSEKIIFYNEYIYNKLISTNISSNGNYEIYSYNNEIYIVFTENTNKTTFVYDACDEKLLGFSIQK